MNKFWKNGIFLTASGVLSLLVAWAIAFAVVGNEYVLPSPWKTFASVWEFLGRPSFYVAFFATLGRAFFAFVLALILGGGFALVAYIYPSFALFLRGIVAVLRSLPTMAVLLLILVGVSHSFAPVLVGVLTLFPLLYSAVYNALCGVDKSLIEMCDVYRVPMGERVKKLYLPTALPLVISDGVAALSFALKLIVSAEVLAFTYRSIGGMMQESAMAVETAMMMALTVLVCLVGMAIELLGGWVRIRFSGVDVCD